MHRNWNLNRVNMSNYLKRFRTIDKIILITIQVTIGKKNEVSPDLNAMSPGSLPKGNRFK